MYSFIKNTLASTLGVLLALGILVLVTSIFFIGSVISSSTKHTAIEKKSILYIPLEGVMQEQKSEDALNEVLGISETGLSLNELCQAIDKAKDLEEIQGIYLEAGLMQSDPASLEELRSYLEKFKKSGKFILSYGDHYTQGAYYLCSVADKVMLNPSGVVDWKGLASQPIFFKDMLAKFGVKIQVFKVGTFKSAVEPFTNTEMSDANRQQVNSYLGSIWSRFLSSVSVSRKISRESLQAYANQYTGFAAATDLRAKHMVDTLTYIDEAKAILKKYSGLKDNQSLNMVSPSDVCAIPDDAQDLSKQIAVYYAAGDIVDVAVQRFSQTSMICAPNVIKDLEELENDDNIKAVVIRINSGGGSAYASEQIWHALKKLSKKKPVITSMSGMAASGAYYMSAGTDYIIAEPTTLTGSIGIFGMIPDVSGLLTEKLGLKFDEVKTNRLSDFGTMSRPLNAEESLLLQKYIERGYALFLDRVAKGRKKTTEQIDKIAQGRVWTGEQALKIGLVDKLGNLNDAVQYAAKKAKLSSYTTVEYPTAEPWYMTLLEQKKNSYYESQMRSTLGEYYQPFVFLKSLTERSYAQARIPYSPNIY